MTEHSIEARERIRATISTEEVLSQTERIIRSDAFDGQRNPQKVLSFLVGAAIKRRPIGPREIALEALGKRDYNRYDSQPRQETGKVRAGLEEFYKKEAKDGDLWIEIPEHQYDVFWRHSPKTLTGQTEFGGAVLSAAKLPKEDATKALQTARKFWPHLLSVFEVYCTEEFLATVHKGRIAIPPAVKMFFDSVGNYHVFITSFDRMEIRIYPLNVWLEEWARVKSSEEGTTSLAVLKFWGQSTQIDSKAGITIHPKLLNELNLPQREPFHTKVGFHPEGFLYFDVPEPLPRPTGKYDLYVLTYAPVGKPRYYYCVLVGAAKKKELKKALAGKASFNLKDYGYILTSGEGNPPKDVRDRLLIKYAAVLKSKSSA